MKGMTITSLFLALTVVAAAKPTPLSNFNATRDRTSTLARNDVNIDIDQIGTQLERDYFQAQPRRSNSDNLSCNLQLNVFDKTRLAQSCD
jgi:hypothetical protein